MQQTSSESAKQISDSFYSSEGIEEALRNIKNCPEDDYSLLVPSVFYLIWTTPNFKKQVALIDSILDSTTGLFHLLLLNHTIEKFATISTDRKDKFYYLVKKTLYQLNFEQITSIGDLEVLEYVWKMINSDRGVVKDWNDELFLAFLSSTKPFIATLIDNIRIDEEKVRKYIDLPIDPKNREALYRLFK